MNVWLYDPIKRIWARQIRCAECLHGSLDGKRCKLYWDRITSTRPDGYCHRAKPRREPNAEDDLK